jgi:alpha-D-ribose 1-methylphosphonate 5-triphosphate synthase subunit PhnG
MLTANDGSSNNNGAGNTATVQFTLTVNDTTAPVISCPASITRSNDAGQCSATVNPGMATATDNCDNAPTVNGTRSDNQPLNAPYPKGTTTITWTATDASGNHSSCAQTITVKDTEPPAISCPASLTLEPTCASGAVATYATPVGTDNCPGAITTRTTGGASGSVFPIGTTTVTYLVTDASTNTASCSFTVTVKTPQATVQDMINAVNAVSSLSGTQKQGLSSKLQAALDAINQGKTNVACNKLSDFISQVSAYISNGTLTSAQGQPLINSATHVRNTIGCTNLGCS